MLYGYKYIHLLHEIWQNGIICKVDLHSLLIWDKHCSELLKSQSDFFFQDFPSSKTERSLFIDGLLYQPPGRKCLIFVCLFFVLKQFHPVIQGGLKLTIFPASASWDLRLQVCITPIGEELDYLTPDTLSRRHSQLAFVERETESQRDCYDLPVSILVRATGQGSSPHFPTLPPP